MQILLHARTACNMKGPRAHTHRELIRGWLWETKGSSLEYIQMLGGGVDAATLVAAFGAGPPPPALNSALMFRVAGGQRRQLLRQLRRPVRRYW